MTKKDLVKIIQEAVRREVKKEVREIFIREGMKSMAQQSTLVEDKVVEVLPERKSKPKKKEPIEISEDKVLDTKFTLSVQTMVAAGTGLASLIGMWYTLQGEIEEAKNLPSLETLYEAEYPSKPEGHNWPRSYEQYKNQVGGLQEDMDAVYDLLDEYEETIKELQKAIKDLERRKKDK